MEDSIFHYFYLPLPLAYGFNFYYCRWYSLLSPMLKTLFFNRGLITSLQIPSTTMNKIEAKNLAEKLLKRINGIPESDVTDDGVDNQDHEQNVCFSKAAGVIDSVHREAASISIDSVPSQTLDELWNSSWSDGNNLLPEDIINHDVRFLKAIIKICS